jgi:serine O-acetyltransferase
MNFKELLKSDKDIDGNTSSKKIVYTYRLGNFIKYECKNPIMKQFYKIKYKLYKLLFMNLNNCEIPSEAKIGKCFSIVHNGRGVVIHPRAEIGDNATILHGVTVGATYTDSNHGVPKIGNNVLFGAGCKVLGGITVGDNVKIGANAVVTKDIPSNCVIGGIPAKVIKFL